MKRIAPNIESDLGYVIDAVKLIRQELNGRVPLIGFTGSPWTLATYMVEGGSSKDFRNIKRLMYDEPETMHHLLERLASTVIDYLNAQILAGAQAQASGPPITRIRSRQLSISVLAVQPGSPAAWGQNFPLNTKVPFLSTIGPMAPCMPFT